MRPTLKGVGVVLGAILFAAAPAVADEAPPVAGPPQPVLVPVVASAPDVTIINPATPAPAPLAPAPEPMTDDTYQTWNSRLFLGGAVLFGASYGAGAIAASASETRGDNRLYVPLIGPWLDLADRDSCPISQSSCDNETTFKILIVGDGILQATGAFLMIDALLFPSQVHRTTTVAQRGTHLTPISFGKGSPGFAVAGTF